ncbi:hypothetical protein KY285_009123 [Solanum tuberosum]|nr:hypothetical protein KY285_009123 [Solanum tuberosum]
MAPGGRVFKQTKLTGETIQDTQSLDEINNPTPLVNTDTSIRIKNGRGKTRGKGLEKLKKAMGSKMKIDIPVDSCEDILKNRSRQWRYKLKQLFESARSEEKARKIEVPELTPENWNRLCDMWINPKHKKRCDINKRLVLNLGKNEPEKVELDRIEFYKHSHYKSKKGWSSLEAETHYNNMKDLQDLYTSGEASMTTDEIVDTVLELEDSLRKAKQKAASAQNNLQNRLNAAETVVENQQTQIQDQQSQIQDQQSQIEALNSQLNTIVARQEEMLRKMQCFARSSPSNREGAP